MNPIALHNLRQSIVLFLTITLLLMVPALAETFTVKPGSSLNARSGPGTQYSKVSRLSPGEQVEELERRGDWSHVRTSDNQTFWVHNGFLVQLQTTRDLNIQKANADDIRVFTQLGHSYLVTAIVFSPDGRHVVTGSSDKTAKLWDVSSGRELRTFTGHTDSVHSVAFSPDGRHVVTGSSDKTAKLWDVSSGRELRTFTGHTHIVNSVAFSPDGRHIVTGSDDETAKLWDVSSGRELRTFKGHTTYVNSVAFSPDGRHVVTGSWDNTAKLWDVSSGRELRTFKGHTGRVLNVAFSPDGRHVVTGSDDNTAKLWDVSSGRELRTFMGLTHNVTSVAFSPDGRYVVTGSDDNTANLWDVSSGRELRTFTGHTHNVTSVAFSPDGHHVVTGSQDKTAKLWEASSGRELRTFTGHTSLVISVAFSPDGRDVVTGSSDKTAKLWDVSSGRELRTFTGHTSLVMSVAFSPDGRHIVTGSDDETAKLWDVSSGRELRTFTGHTDSVLSVAFSPDGRHVVTGSWDNTAKLWDVSSGRELRTFKGHTWWLNSIAFSPDGRHVVTGSWDNTAKLWDVSSGRELRSFTGHTAYVNSVAFSPDGRHVVTGSSDKTAKLWDVSSGRELRSFTGHTHNVNSVAFSPDGRHMVTGSYDGTAKLWDVSSGRELRSFTGHTNSVRSVAFSPNGRHVVTGSWDGSARMWNVTTGSERVQLTSFTDGSWLAMTPEGFFNASGPEAAQHINVLRGLEVLSIDNFYNALYRPDLVREAIAGDPDGKVAAAAKDLDLRKLLETGQPPTVRFLGARGLGRVDVLVDVEIDGDSLTVEAELTDNGGGIGRAEWRVNGSVQGVQRGLGAAAAQGSAGGETHKINRKLFLTPGKNTISLVVYNKANLIASNPAELHVSSSAAELSKPSLHVLAVGVDDYLDHRLKLNYATSDARALGNAFRKSSGELYEDVLVTYVLDDDVNADKLRSAFSKVGDAVRPQDVFVFFLAGHGKTLDGRYYFLPQDFRYSGDDSIRAAAIGQDQLQDWLSLIPAQKSVMLYDTCESGTLAADAGTRGLESLAAIERLSRAVGRTIMTAATDTQPALEGYRNHGLFTYTLLEAFAHGDSDKDNQIEINELIGYVDERLPVLSKEVFGYTQLPQYKSRGNTFSLGQPVAILEGSDEIIPKAATHVVIGSAEIRETSDPTSAILDRIAPGVLIRVLEERGGKVLIARKGVKRGWVPTASVVPMQ